MIRRLLAVLVTGLLGLLTASALATPAHAAPVTPENCEAIIVGVPGLQPDDLPEECVPVWEQMQAEQQQPTPSATPTAQPTPAPQPTPGTAPTPGATAPAAPTVYPNVTPQTAAEEWAVEAGRSMHGLLAQLDQTLSERPGSFGEEFARPYAVAWGLGLVLLAFAITVVTAQSAGGRPAAQELLRSAGLRAWIYYPLMLVAPTILYSLYAWMGDLSGWFGDQGASSRSAAFEQIGRRLTEAESPGQLLTGGVLMALIVPAAYVVLALVILIEVTLAQYGLFVLVCLVPPLAALAIHPRFRPAVSGLLGVIIGALLVPPMLQLTLWATLSTASATITAETLDTESTFSAFALVGVCLLLAALAPLALGLAMPRVVMALAPAYSRELVGLRRALGQVGGTSRDPAVRLSRMTGRGAPRAGSAVVRGAGTVTGLAGARVTPRATGPVGVAQAGAGLVRRGYSNVKSKLRTRNEPGPGGTHVRGSSGAVNRRSQAPDAAHTRPINHAAPQSSGHHGTAGPSMGSSDSPGTSGGSTGAGSGGPGESSGSAP